MKNLESYGVQEMSSKEIRKTDGGVVDPITVLCMIGAGLIVVGIKESIDYPSSFWAGFTGN